MLLLLGLSDFSENGRNQVKSALLNLYSPDDSTFKIELISILAWFEGSKLLFWSVFRPSILFIFFILGQFQSMNFSNLALFGNPNVTFWWISDIQISTLFTFWTWQLRYESYSIIFFFLQNCDLNHICIKSDYPNTH